MNLSLRHSSLEGRSKTIAHKLWYYVSNFSASASVLNLSAVSINRLLAVVFPLRHENIMENFGWKAMLVMCWTLLVGFFILDRFLQAAIPVKAFINLAAMISVIWILPIMVFILSKTLQFLRAFKPLFVLALYALSYAVAFLSYFTIVIHLAKQRNKRKQMSTSSLLLISA